MGCNLLDIPNKLAIRLYYIKGTLESEQVKILKNNPT